jgi:hypothetical protein
MAARIHRPLKVIAFHAHDIRRQRYELSKQLQDLHIDVELFSETHLKSHEKFFVPNYHLYRTDRFPERKGIHHNHVGLCYSYIYIYTHTIRTLDKGEAYSLETNPSSRQRKCCVRTVASRVQLQNKISGRESQGACGQDELIGDKPPVVK